MVLEYAMILQLVYISVTEVFERCSCKYLCVGLLSRVAPKSVETRFIRYSVCVGLQ
jgi:hypothetical protein